jgi:hypothetical protein
MKKPLFMYTGVIVKQKWPLSAEEEIKKEHLTPLSHVSLDSGHREGAARKDVNAHPSLSLNQQPSAAANCHSTLRELSYDRRRVWTTLPPLSINF